MTKTAVVKKRCPIQVTPENHQALVELSEKYSVSITELANIAVASYYKRVKRREAEQDQQSSKRL